MPDDVSLTELAVDMKATAITALFRWPEWKIIATTFAGFGIAIFPVGTHGMYYLIGAAYVLNLVFGLMAAWLVGEPLKRRKLFRSFGTLLFYVSFPILTYKLVELAPDAGGPGPAYFVFYAAAAICVGDALTGILKNVHRSGMMDTTRHQALLDRLLKGSAQRDEEPGG